MLFRLKRKAGLVEIWGLKGDLGEKMVLNDVLLCWLVFRFSHESGKNQQYQSYHCNIVQVISGSRECDKWVSGV